MVYQLIFDVQLIDVHFIYMINDLIYVNGFGLGIQIIGLIYPTFSRSECRIMDKIYDKIVYTHHIKPFINKRYSAVFS